jgi:hypothetical protein
MQRRTCPVMLLKEMGESVTLYSSKHAAKRSCWNICKSYVHKELRTVFDFRRNPPCEMD